LPFQAFACKHIQWIAGEKLSPESDFLHGYGSNSEGLDVKGKMSLSQAEVHWLLHELPILQDR